MRWMLAIAVVGACGFSHGVLSTGDASGSGGDDASDIDIDAPLGDAPVDTPVGQMCLGSNGSLLVICYAPGTEPMAPYTPPSLLDTSSSTSCDRIINQALPNPQLCIKHGSSITIGGSTRVTGSRPLVLVSFSTITVSGTLSVSAGGAGADTGTCNPAMPGGNESSGSSSKGGGGGGGGGFGTAGGKGGPSGSQGGGNGAASVGLTGIRGGCRGASGGNDGNGNGGRGGDGGGALYLIAAQTISVPGSLHANGGGGSGGGRQGGGGGGGAGGLIGLDAPSITVAGSVFANGGGGGEGGDSSNGGQDGGEASMYNAGGLGGNQVQNGGNGGDGAFLMTAASNGASGTGGGGGGGGAGRIRRYGGTGLAGKISPPAP